MALLVSVNLSAERGTGKQPSATGEVTSQGIDGDAHAGSWHRQVSLLSMESIRRFGEQCGREFRPGEFAENLTTEGLDLESVAMLDRIHVGEFELEVTQIGKECHGHACAIARDLGKCVMPRSGIFCRVIQTGTIRPGDPMRHLTRQVAIAIITVSDRASRGEYRDASGPAVRARVQHHFARSQWRAQVAESLIVPDDVQRLQQAIEQTLASGCRILITTGGTGLGPRDITPDVIRPMLDREIPGVMESIRVKYGSANPSALLSRSIAGMIGSTLVYALPGSSRAVEEYLDEILPTLDHSLRMAAGIDSHG
jgi:molybdenum cofactor synthesis domain-containing protein